MSAPSKRLVESDHSGHPPHLEEPGRFAAFMTDVVLHPKGRV